MAMSATQLRVGMIVEHQNEPHRVMDLIHVTPGNKRGFVQTKLRNLRSGLQTEHKFRSDDQVDRIVLDQQEMEFLYQSRDEYHFMNVETYEQIALSGEVLGGSVLYLVPNLRLQVEFHDGAPITVSVPKTVDLRVTDTPPGMKTASATGEMKPATLETGLVTRVPSFINPGDTVRVDSDTGEYLSRVK